MGGFQNRVNLVLPPAVEGDFASANPRADYRVSANRIATHP